MEHDVGPKRLGMASGCRQGAWLTNRSISFTCSHPPVFFLSFMQIITYQIAFILFCGVSSLQWWSHLSVWSYCWYFCVWFGWIICPGGGLGLARLLLLLGVQAVRTRWGQRSQQGSWIWEVPYRRAVRSGSDLWAVMRDALGGPAIPGWCGWALRTYCGTVLLSWYKNDFSVIHSN